jgi:hypothetical protein
MPSPIVIQLHNKTYKIWIHVKELGTSPINARYDMEIECPQRITGDEFQALKKYLKTEGHFEEARRKTARYQNQALPN